MPDLLGPTMPVPGYDTAPVRITTPQPADTVIQNIVNPEVVVRPDGRTEQQDAGSDNPLAARYDSNFMSFVQRLRGNPDLAGTFLHILQDFGVQISSGISEGFAAELGQFVEFLRMDESQFKSFIQNQVQSGTRFSGPLFQLLRAAFNGSQSELIQNEVLQFVRRFSNYSSTPHLEAKMTRTLNEMARFLPSQWGDRVSDLSAQFQNGVAAGDRAGNLRLLREQLFPLIARYVSLTHDHGRARSLLSTLTLDLARYENGSEESLAAALRQLSANGVLPEELRNLDDEELLKLLKDTGFHKAARSNSFADRLADVTDRALQGEGGVKAQEAFRNILSSILLNESVYMPLMHIMIPIQWQDRLMFSEMWVDPDADPESSARGEGKVMRILIKMDIENLGAFDLVIGAQKTDVALQLGCPEWLSPFSQDITGSLRSILTRNGFQPSMVKVAPMKRPLTISEVFPKLFQGVNGINVKI